MTDLLQIKNLVVRYALGEGDLEAFRDLFAAATAGVNFNDASPDLAGFVDRVDALLIQRDLGEIDDDALESALSAEAGVARVTIEDEQVFHSFNLGVIEYEENKNISRDSNASLAEAQ
jgi:hypothetical protein